MANNKNFKVKNGLDVSGTVTAGGNLLATHSSLGYITKAEFEALAEERKKNRGGSGFDEWGKHYTNTSAYPNINEGMWTGDGSLTTYSDHFIMGNNNLPAGVSRTNYPIANVNGVLHNLSYIKYDNDDRFNKIQLPTAPTVTHADSSNSGMVLNGRNMIDTSGWSGVNGGTLSVDNNRLKLTPDGTQLGFGYQLKTTVIGVEYTVEIEVGDSDSGNMHIYIGPTLYSGALYSSETLVGGKKYYKKVTFVATATTTFIHYRTDTINNSIILHSAFMCPSHELSRSDLVFLETWHENVADKDFVYPLGNIQYRGADTDGLTGIVSGAFTGKETYSLFGNWQSDNALVGKGYVWSTMSEANKVKFASNPENNCYIDGDNIVQVRYRVRVVQGLGDEWYNVDPQVASLKFNTNLLVQMKGKYTSFPYGDLNPNTTNTLTSHGYTGTGADLTTMENGQFKGRYTNTGFTVDGTNVYALPIALVHRRNQGAYHPKFNPNGTGLWYHKDLTTNQMPSWYYEIAYKPESIAECFDIGLVGHAVPKDRGYIGSTSGRPDGLFYDQVHESDIIDLRNSSEKVTDFERLLEREFNKAVSGEVRGEEGEWEFNGKTFGNGTNLLYDYGTHLNLVMPNADAAKFVVGSKFFIEYFDGTSTYYDNAIVKSIGGGTVTIYAPNLSSQIANGWHADNGIRYIKYTKQSTRKKSNTLLHCDIIGNPANYYRGQTYIDSGTKDVAIDNVVWAKTASGGGTAGNFYKALTVQASIDLATQDYSNATNWEDLGADWDGAGSWRTGVSGTPLVVGENGEDYISTGTNYPAIKLSKKYSTFKFALWSADNGVTWTYVSNPTLNSIRNTCVVDDPTISGRITMVFYTTHTNMTESAVNSEVLKLGDAYASNSYADELGRYLTQSLIGKITTSVGLPHGCFIGETTHASLLSGSKMSTWSPLQHRAFIFGSTTSNGIKIVPHIAKENNRAYLQLVFKEMKYTTSWGDDSKFNIVDNVSTTTDDNGQVVLCGQKRIELPFFIGDDR